MAQFHFSFQLLSQQSSRIVNIPLPAHARLPQATALFIRLANTLTYEYTNFKHKINKDRQHGKRERRRY